MSDSSSSASSKRRASASRRHSISNTKSPPPPTPPSASAALKDLKTEFCSFIQADEMGPILDAFSRCLRAAGLSPSNFGAPRLEEIRAGLEEGANFRQKRIFQGLAARKARSKDAVLPPQTSDANRVIVVVGGGPCGLKAALEASLLGFTVTIVEGRSTFSRHNVLKTWGPTVDDMMELGHGVYHPSFQANGTHYMGTRELQMTLLKSALLLGVRFVFSAYVGGVLAPPAGSARHSVWTIPSKPASAAVGVLSLKPNSSVENADRKSKVDFMESAVSDDGAISEAAPAEAKTQFPFDFLIDGSGEKSFLTRNLGFDKSLQKYGPAIGFVANFVKDPKKSDKDFPAELIAGYADTSAAIYKSLWDRGIAVESVEYLRGGTHFVAATIMRKTAVDFGIFRKDLPTIVECLTPENVDETKLYEMGRLFAASVGLSQDIEFAPVNPVQIFDFSVKGQLRKPARDLPFLFLPVGDALSSPYWPQGLGVNRGIHTAMDAVWAAREQAVGGDSMAERDMAFMLMNYPIWQASVLAPQKSWTADPVTRYHSSMLQRIRLDNDKRLAAKITPRAQALISKMKK